MSNANRAKPVLLPVRAQQRLFITAYIANGGHGTNAALEAGYKHAPIASSRILKLPHVRAEVMRLEMIRDRANDVEAYVDRAWVMRKLVTIAERCMQAEPVMDADGNPTGTYKFHGTAAIKAVELLGRAVGVFEDGHGGAKTGPAVNIQLVEYNAPLSGPSPALQDVMDTGDPNRRPEPSEAREMANVTDLEPIHIEVQVVAPDDTPDDTT